MEKQAEQRPDSQAAGFVANIGNWEKLCKHLYIWDYACNFRNYLLPFPNYRTMPENLRTYQKNHIVGVMQQGNFSYGEAAGLSDLEIYLAARLLWNPGLNENEVIDDFICGVYGKECYPFIREYVDLLCDAVTGHPLTLYQNTDAPYFSDALVEKADELFGKALATVRTETGKRYLQKEYLSVLFMKATRMELENPERNALIDQLYKGVKEFRIAEIRERKHLEICFENLRKARYAAASDDEYLLYYIMK
jgi:hypothetical protein